MGLNVGEHDLSNFTPFTNTGVSVGLELVDGLRYTQYVVNGWDLVFDVNDAKSYGGQLVLSLDDPSPDLRDALHGAAALRIEWRHDHSNRAFFLGGRGAPSQHHQDTAAVELNHRF